MSRQNLLLVVDLGPSFRLVVILLHINDFLEQAKFTLKSTAGKSIWDHLIGSWLKKIRVILMKIPHQKWHFFSRSALQDGIRKKKMFNDKSTGSVLPQPFLSLWTNAMSVSFIAVFIITDSYVASEQPLLIQATILLSSKSSSDST